MKKIILLIMFFASTLFAQFDEADSGQYFDNVTRGLKNTSEWKGVDSGKVLAALQYIVNFSELDSLGLSKEAKQDSLIAAIIVLKTYAQNLTIKSQTDSTNARLSLIHNELIKKLSQTTGDSLKVGVDEINYLLQQVRTNVDGLETFADSTNERLSRIHSELIKKLSQETGDSVEVNIEEGNSLLQILRTTLATKSNQDLQIARADTLNNRTSQSLALLQLIRAAVQGTLTVNVSNQISDFATDTKLELVRLLLASIDGKDFATAVKQDTLNERISRTIDKLQQMEDRQAVLQDSINVLNATELLIKGILSGSKTIQDSTLANVKETNYLLQEVENRQAVLQDSLNVLNGSINQMKGYLNSVEANQLTQIVQGDSLNNRISQALGLLQLVRAAIEGTLDVNVANQITGYSTAVKQDTLISRLALIHTELIKKLSQITGDSLFVNLKESNELLQLIRASVELIDNAIAGNEIQADVLTLPDVDINDISKGTQTNDIKVTLDGESVPVTNSGTFAVQATVEGKLNGGYGNITVGATAVQLSGSSVPCKTILITNNSASETLYYGYDNSVTTSNGQGILGHLDSVELTIDNLNKVYLIGSGAGIDVRYSYEN